MNKNKEVKFVVLGYGFIGKKHAELIHLNEQSYLAAVIEIDEEKQRFIRAEYPYTVIFSTLEEFFKSNIRADFIAICTPNHLHCLQSKSCLQQGLHVICEKPLGLKLEECLELENVSKETGKQIFCVLQNRYSPPIQWLKSVISNDKLGDIIHVQVNCYWNRDDRYYYPNGKKHDWKGTKEKDGGVLFTQFSHFVDILTWVLGEVKDVHHISNNFVHQGKTDFNDTGSIIFKLSNNAIGNFNYSTAVWDKNLESSMIILGSKGSIKIGGQYMDKVEYCHIENYSLPEIADSQPPNDYGHFKGSAQNHQFVIQNSIDYFLNNSPIDVDLKEGILSVKNIEKLSK